MSDQKVYGRKHGARNWLTQLLITPRQKRAVWVTPGSSKSGLSFEIERGSYHWITKRKRCAVIGG